MNAITQVFRNVRGAIGLGSALPRHSRHQGPTLIQALRLAGGEIREGLRRLPVRQAPEGLSRSVK